MSFNKSMASCSLFLEFLIWSLSPNYFNNNNANGFNVNSGNNSLYVVIYLKLGTEFETGGDGTPTNPYVVKYN